MLNITKPIANRLLGILGYRLVTKSLFERYMQLEAHSRSASSEIPANLLASLASERPAYLQLYKYGVYASSSREAHGTFWMTHEAGFFSCLTTLMWSLSDLLQVGIVPTRIDNTFSMNQFKDVRQCNAWEEIFRQPREEDLAALLTNKPKSYGIFDHHSDYTRLITDTLGLDWINAFHKAYFSPVEQVIEAAERFDEECGISNSDTIGVCIRGTDKWKEIRPTPLPVYFHAVDRLAEKYRDPAILIQTDQLQIRRSFQDRYGANCTFIADLPVTRGDKVIHESEIVTGARSMFAKNLVAMCLAMSNCKELVTHTGNVGFFLSSRMFMKGKQITQFQ